jgi:hypothetical protein
MSTRREFFVKSAITCGAVMMHPLLQGIPSTLPKIEISLAEWSLHRSIRAGKFSHLEFAAKAKTEYGISTVEYVNGLFGNSRTDFREAGTNPDYLREMLQRSKDAGVSNHLIMVDEEGHLAGVKETDRLLAVDNHKKWLDAAKYLECKSIRLNLHGEGDPEKKAEASIDSLSRLGEFAGNMGLNILVENHGGDSSKGYWLASIMKAVNRPNVGTLPDFGNFCISHDWGTTQEVCENEYDRYKGIEEMLPFAKGLSAKTYDFDENGEQPKIDYKRMMDMVKIEFEGFDQPEDEGIRKTLRLLEKHLST